MIITFHKGGESIDLAIDDSRCDALLDFLAAKFQKPNPDADRRWLAMMAKREAGDAVPKNFRKRPR